MPNRAVFLDRDHTIIEDPGYISDPAGVKLLPGADLAIKALRQAGYLAVVVTNQSAVARGLVTEETLEKIHGEMRRQLAARSMSRSLAAFRSIPGWGLRRSESLAYGSTVPSGWNGQ